MAKRFVETEIWHNEDFFEATSEQKLLALYLVTNCNYIGIFKKPMRLISMEIGFTVTKEMILNNPIKVEEINGKFWLSSFCDFQYGNLKETCKPHKRYIEELKKEGIFERVCKGYEKGINTLEEKEKEKDIGIRKKNKTKKETKKKHGEYLNVLLSESDYQKLVEEFPNDHADKIERLSSYMASTGKSYKNHLATIRNWAKKDNTAVVAKPSAREQQRARECVEEEINLEELML